LQDISKLMATIENLLESADIELKEVEKSSMTAKDKKIYSGVILGKKIAYYTVLEILGEQKQG